MAKVLFNHCREPIVAQVTCAAPEIEILLDPGPPLMLIDDLQQRHPLVTEGSGQRIRESPGEELAGAGEIEVRQIPARAPAGEAEARFLGSEPAVPAPFITDNLVDVVAHRSRRRRRSAGGPPARC